MQYKVGDKVWVAMLITDWHENGSDAEVLDEHGSDLVWVNKAVLRPRQDKEPLFTFRQQVALRGVGPYTVESITCDTQGDGSYSYELLDEAGYSIDYHDEEVLTAWVKESSAPAAEQTSEPSKPHFYSGDLVGIKPHSCHSYIVDDSYIDKSSNERYYTFYDHDSGRYLSYAESKLYDWLAKV